MKIRSILDVQFTTLYCVSDGGDTDASWRYPSYRLLLRRTTPSRRRVKRPTLLSVGGLQFLGHNWVSIQYSRMIHVQVGCDAYRWFEERRSGLGAHHVYNLTGLRRKRDRSTSRVEKSNGNLPSTAVAYQVVLRVCYIYHPKKTVTFNGAVAAYHVYLSWRGQVLLSNERATLGFSGFLTRG